MTAKTMPVRVRFAPSPTGPFHVGGARTVLYNWLFAHHHGGAFVLRIEDTDRNRYSPGAEADMVDSLLWLGLDWDEGPKIGGSYGPYIQSERVDIHRHYAQLLLDSGHAYKCFCTPQRLEQLRREQEKTKETVGYDRRCRDLSAEEVAANEQAGLPYVVRLKMPREGVTMVHDRIRGDIAFENALLDDIVLLKSDGFPTYHLANVIDDHLMKITHVMRGDEWLPSTPIHVVLYQAFGWEMPVFAHLPLILSPTGKGKMAKRRIIAADGKEYPVMVDEFRAAGYLPEALVNYLARLGWAYDDHTEIFSRQDLVEKFSLDAVTGSPAAFSYDKLLWMNGYYIRQLEPEDLARRMLPFLQQAGLVPPECPPECFQRVLDLVPLVRERMHTLQDAAELTEYFFRDVSYPDPALLVSKGFDVATTRRALEATRSLLATIPTFDHEHLEPALRGLAEMHGWKPGQLFMPIRVALTGRTVSPGLFEMMVVMGREQTLARLDKAMEALGRVELKGEA